MLFVKKKKKRKKYRNPTLLLNREWRDFGTLISGDYETSIIDIVTCNHRKRRERTSDLFNNKSRFSVFEKYARNGKNEIEKFTKNIEKHH